MVFLETGVYGENLTKMLVFTAVNTMKNSIIVQFITRQKRQSI
jgi:hypothetical protein